MFDNFGGIKLISSEEGKNCKTSNQLSSPQEKVVDYGQRSAATTAFNAMVLNQNQLSAALISVGNLGTKSDVRDRETGSQQQVSAFAFVGGHLGGGGDTRRYSRKLSLLGFAPPSYHFKQIWPYFNTEPIWGLDFTRVSIFQQEMPFVTPQIESLSWHKINKANYQRL